ncbi:hypothetical protein [Micromonospora sp. WMMD736]|uniref:hypothetical protein n=1 Tax=Micromonospora sp. WMMD736 TaxID=3404112 RepID=UPI003B92AB3A
MDVMADYAWVITKDHITPPEEESDEGIAGPRLAPDDLLKRVKAGEGHTFYLYDGDGERYYTGRLLTTGDMGSEEHCAAPLDDFGTGWAGCTDVRWHGHPEWAIG